MGIRAFQLPPIFRLIFDGLIGMMPNILECPRIRSGVVNVVSLLIAPFFLSKYLVIRFNRDFNPW